MNRLQSRRMHAYPFYECFRAAHFFLAEEDAASGVCHGRGCGRRKRFKKIREVFGKRGAIPPLPRNCKRGEQGRAVCSHWTKPSGKVRRKLMDAQVRRPARGHFLAVFRSRWEDRRGARFAASCGGCTHTLFYECFKLRTSFQRKKALLPVFVAGANAADVNVSKNP